MLKDKVAFITGSSRGIGWAIARLFAQNGASIILNGHSDEAKLQEQAATIQEQYGVDCIGLNADQSDAKSIQGCYQTIFKKYKRLDILVNNVGILDDNLLGMIPTESVVNTFGVNAFSVIYNMQSAARLMTRKKQGSIINISSIIGVCGNSGQVVYGGSKAAVIGMTKSAAKELAAQNIRVNAIAPGFINTDMVKELTQEVFQQRMASIAMDRIGEPEDVAKTALFLASDLSAYVTGQTIGVDGGMLI